jgi:hypothetical protein
LKNRKNAKNCSCWTKNFRQKKGSFQVNLSGITNQNKPRYVPSSVTDIKRILQITGFIPKSGYKKKDLSRCKNQETMVMGESMKLDPKKLYITPSRYCHSMDDLLEYLKSSPYGNTDPLGRHDQNIWKSKSEKNVFWKHPYLLEAYLKELKINGAIVFQGLKLEKLQGVKTTRERLNWPCRNTSPLFWTYYLKR